MQLSLGAAQAQPATAVAGQPERGGPASQALLHSDRDLARWVSAHSADVSASRAELQAQRAAASGSRLFMNPTLDIGVADVALGQTNPPNFARGKTLQYNAGISQTVELAKRGPRIKAAELQATAAEARLQSTVAERVGLARGALAELLFSLLRAQQLDASLQEARAAGVIAQGRMAHSDLSGVDYDRMLIDLAALETDRAHAEADALSAEAQCAVALQAPCSLREADVETLDAAAPVPVSVDPGYDLRQRADIRALATEAQSSSETAQLAAARAVPDLTFRLGYTHDSFTVSGALANSLSLSVSAPLPMFDRGQYAKNEALANAAQARAQAHAQWVRARGDLAGLYARKRAVEGALHKLEHDSLPRANGVLEAEERGLKEGQLDLNDLLLARRAAIAVRLQTLELHFELFQVRNALRQVMGLDQALTQG
ncbi:MAG TPA: TolC family protein [Polyangiales bacterium]|nr:TolC family protein [Polyangiales bacterium]